MRCSGKAEKFSAEEWNASAVAASILPSYNARE
jgi:hypothetical protein